MLIDAKENADYFSTFYIRRSFRILPLYFAALAIGILVGTDQVIHPVWYLTITQNIWMTIHDDKWIRFGPHIWSLGVEEQFYLFLPMLLWLTPRYAIRSACICFIGLAIAIRWAMAWAGLAGTVSMNVLFLARMDTLLIGVVCADLYRDQRVVDWLRANFVWLYGTFAMVAIPVAIILAKDWAIPMALCGYTLVGLLCALVLLIAMTESHGPISTLTNWAPIRRMGILAYFLFLVHPLVPQIVSHLTGYLFMPSFENSVLMTVSIAILVIAAELSWRYFEKPLISLGHRLTSERRLALAA